MEGDTAIIRLAKENMKFSAGHFTIFSASERERLHGHNFRVEADIEARMLGNGMCFDYGLYKDRIVALCRELNEWFILPSRSPHLRIEEEGEYLYATFAGQRIPFLRADVLLLPIANATLEEFAGYFIERLAEDRQALREHRIDAIEVRVFSGPGQSAGRRLRFDDD
ncbi:6-pyruvoyl tetrahydrobiopterin synthase [Pseudoxanthomonas jiangsuensis]|uniref:6-pyruvoyl trahydropterin synthase family protein n=1 Tax=Pseudoxanthomonas jiangsuensis TaxID=619688 RepID=UPI00139202B6|nr:6-carboxytetrahydropterin synthase [Pseudoxanthomonas jiangsuensis]KAF1699191.1 6-pyruvoyl tetrahydrobiopterin synthase [Pseudoxanthomonas jiangsuensis]